MENATPRKTARPPSQAKSFTPMNCSQLKGGFSGVSGSVESSGAGETGSGGGDDAAGDDTGGTPELFSTRARARVSPKVLGSAGGDSAGGTMFSDTSFASRISKAAMSG